MGSAGIPSRRALGALLACAASLLSAPPPGGAAAAGVAGGDAPTVREAEARARLDVVRRGAPVRFEPNRGQSAPEVRWLARAPGMTLFLTDREAVLSLASPAGREALRGRRTVSRAVGEPGPARVLRMEFAGAAPEPRFEGSGPLDGVSNYLLGKDPSRWRTGVPNLGAVTARGLWPGVDLRFRGDPARLEYDLLVAPGADPGAARFRFTGQDSMRVGPDGSLVLAFPEGEVVQSAPRIWEETPDSGRRAVAGGFKVLGDGIVGFEVGTHDPSLPLVVDPTVDWATYLGGTGADTPSDVTVDGSGNVIVTGWTTSTDFPLTSAYQGAHAGGTNDAFVTKYASALNSITFSTYLGGTGDDRGVAVAADSSGSVLLAGWTASTDFPVSSAYQGTNAGGAHDVFLVKLPSSGTSLTWATYFGGSGLEEPNDIAADSSGNPVVVGVTDSSTTFPISGAAQATYGGGVYDAFAFSLSSAGSTLRWSTFYGGTLVDAAFGVALDSGGAIYFGGNTLSTDFPTVNPLQSTHAGGTGTFPDDSFLVKLTSSAASVTYATYLGGGGYDDCSAVAVGPGGTAYLAGSTSSTNFPVSNAVQGTHGGGTDDAWMAKVNAAGSAVSWATYVGGSGSEYGFGVAVDSTGAATGVGITFTQTGFPTSNAFSATYGGGNDDGWIAKISSSGSPLNYCSYIAGNGYDEAYAVALDSSGWALVIGATTSTGFSKGSAPQGSPGGGNYDSFVLRVALTLPAAPTLLSAQASGSSLVQLGWTDNSTNEQGFEIERRTDATSFARILTTTSGVTSYQDSGVGPGTNYTYRVRAMNADGNSAYTNEASAATSPVVLPPTVPANFVATPTSASTVSLAWEDRSDNEISFEIYRKEESGAFAIRTSVATGNTTFQDTGLSPATIYTYRIRAVGSSGASPYTANSSAETFPTLTLTPTKGALTDSVKAGKDKVKVVGTFAFLAESPDDQLNPVGEVVSLYLLWDSTPWSLTIPSGDAGWKVKNGKFTWKSPKTSPTKITVVLDPVKGKFTVAVSRIDFAQAPVNPMRVTVRCGADGGVHRADWLQKKTGVFKYVP